MSTSPFFKSFFLKNTFSCLGLYAQKYTYMYSYNVKLSKGVCFGWWFYISTSIRCDFCSYIFSDQPMWMLIMVKFFLLVTCFCNYEWLTTWYCILGVQENPLSYFAFPWQKVLSNFMILVTRFVQWPDLLTVKYRKIFFQGASTMRL